MTDEYLQCRRESDNVNDPHAVAITRDNTMACHVPRRISAMCNLFLVNGGSVHCRVTERRHYSLDLPQGGLEIPCQLIFSGEDKMLEKVKKLFTAMPGISVAENEADIRPPKK